MLSRVHRRLEKEKQQIQRDHKTLQVIIPDDEILQWRVIFEAPQNSIYQCETYT